MSELSAFRSLAAAVQKKKPPEDLSVGQEKPWSQLTSPFHQPRGHTTSTGRHPIYQLHHGPWSWINALRASDKNASDEDDLRLSPGYERYVGGSEP